MTFDRKHYAFHEPFSSVPDILTYIESTTIFNHFRSLNTGNMYHHSYRLYTVYRLYCFSRKFWLKFVFFLSCRSMINQMCWRRFVIKTIRTQTLRACGVLNRMARRNVQVKVGQRVDRTFYLFEVKKPVGRQVHRFVPCKNSQ